MSPMFLPTYNIFFLLPQVYSVGYLFLKYLGEAETPKRYFCLCRPTFCADLASVVDSGSASSRSGNSWEKKSLKNSELYSKFG